MTGDDLPGLRVLRRVERGAFPQQVCGTGVSCAVPGVIFRGENRDGERFPEGVQAAGEFAQLAANPRVEFRGVAVESLAVGWVQDNCGL